MAEQPTESSTTEQAPKKEKKPKTKKGPVLSFVGPEGASRIVTLMAALVIILQANYFFWTLGIDLIRTQGPDLFYGLNVFCGIMLYIIGVIIILMIGIVEISVKYLEKVEMLEKLYRFEILFVFAALTLLFEVLGTFYLKDNLNYTVYLSVLIGGVLLVIAAVLEIIKEKDIKPSKVMILCGCGYAVFEAIILFITTPLVFENYWDGSIAIIIVILLLLAIFNKIKFIPYEWWMVLIFGVILWGWVNPAQTVIGLPSVSGGGVGGTLVLILFIFMLL